MPGIRPRALCVLYQEHKWLVANTLPLNYACSLTVQFYLKKGKKISEDESGWDTFSLSA